MSRDWLDLIARGLKKPPRYVVQRSVHELNLQLERLRAPRRAKRLTADRLARKAGHSNVDEWWKQLADRPFVAAEFAAVDFDRVCTGERDRILAAAERAHSHQVDLMGSGVLSLGPAIDWHRDYKTGFRWEPAYCHDIDYSNHGRPSDVKFPWELSRMQWMIPLGQAFMLDSDERHAAKARDLIDAWIFENPCASSVNWSCTMEAALRIVTWTWLFHAFSRSASWSEPGFRGRFLSALYLHGDFTARNLERADINGNHFTADAAGLVFAGLFFGNSGIPAKWQEAGWRILCEEVQLQVFADGVDFEASVPYHRLVQELFLLPAIYREQCGLVVPKPYRERLLAMARFTEAYSRADGSVPLWGDADDARVLPLGGQPLNDHRYLFGLVGSYFDDEQLSDAFSGPRSEIYWMLGKTKATSLPNRSVLDAERKSIAFPEGGFYVLCNRRDHVFVDCGPIGLSGRGGHGHNDLLSFEAVLDGVHVVSDCGAYVYTANCAERNLFRSTAYHNTPMIDDEEINRFVRWDHLWTFHDDARHEVRLLELDQPVDRLVVSHNGYLRLPSPVGIVRSFLLDHDSHCLTVSDTFEGEGEHRVVTRLHLAPEVEVQHELPGNLTLLSAGRQISLGWSDPQDWKMQIEAGRISPSYGVVRPCVVLVWSREGPLRPLTIAIQPMRAGLRVWPAKFVDANW